MRYGFKVASTVQRTVFIVQSVGKSIPKMEMLTSVQNYLHSWEEHLQLKLNESHRQYIVEFSAFLSISTVILMAYHPVEARSPVRSE